MKSNTVIIYASPKKDSFTFRLLESTLGDLNCSLFFDCYKELPAPCTDCGFCKTNNSCSFKDLDAFFTAFEKAEKIVFAFPVYNCGLPAPLKALVDRFQRYYSASFVRNIKPPIKGSRKVTVIMTMGGKEDVSQIVLKQLMPMFTISGCKLSTCYTLLGTDAINKDENLNPNIYNFEEKI